MPFLQPTGPTNRIAGALSKRDAAKANKKQSESSNQDSVVERIRKEILDKLGMPDDFFRIDAPKVDTNAYRANVLCSKRKPGTVFSVVSRPHSYYVTVEDDKLTFSPAIVKTY